MIESKLSSSLAPPCELRCEELHNPLGIDRTNPRFSWQLNSSLRGAMPTAFQLLVASSWQLLQQGIGDRWDSGKVTEYDNINIVYQGSPLTSREHCYWAVRCWDAHEQATAYSEAAEFEMALLLAEDWQGEWIAADEAVNSPLFRQEFQLSRPIAQARVYICGLGYHELRINGQKVSDQLLVPSWTDYDAREMRKLLYPYEDHAEKRVFYLCHDVTSYLQSGGNVLGVWLGNGMHNQRVRVIEGEMWYGKPRFLMQLEIVYSDGQREIIASQPGWPCDGSPITFDNPFVGEIYDARLTQAGWDQPGFDDSCWLPALAAPKPSGRLQAQLSPPERLQQSIIPISRHEPQPGIFVFDLGQNISGWAQLRVQGLAGQIVKIRFSEEIASDGMLDMLSVGEDIPSGQEQRDIFILQGIGEEIYEPRFIWHGFRYIEVSGYPGIPALDALLGRVVHSDIAPSGSFSCSSTLLTRLNEVFRWTLRTNYHGCLPSDCPSREKLGYTGDGQLTTEAAMYNFQVSGLYRKWYEDICSAQHPESGFVPHTAPFYGGGGGHAWGSAIIIVGWQLYRHYGDIQLLKSAYPRMKKWLEFQAGCVDEQGIIDHEWPGSWCLGDWAVPGGFSVDGGDALPNSLPNTAYYGYNARMLSRIASLLGHDNDATEYSVLATKVAADFHRHFYQREAGRYAQGLHASEAFALALGAVPEAEEEPVLTYLLGHLQRLDKHFDTGILGTPLLLDVLAQNQQNELALKLLMQQSYPSLGYMLARDATTLWENWDESQGSHNHPMYGSFSAWLYRVIVGIELDDEKPAYRRFTVRPPVVEAISYAAADIATVRGALAVAWQRGEEEFSLQITVPVGSTAEIVLPLADITNPRLQENGQQIPLETSKPQIAGILAVKLVEARIIVTVRSGKYCFNVG